MSKKQEIIDAAIREFGEHSYDAASINRIIKASGTSKGTFYHYFRDKKDLYFSIIYDMIRIKQEYMGRMMAQVENQADFFELMKAQVKVAAQLVEDMPELYQFGVMYAKESSGIKDEISEKFIAPIGDYFQQIVEVAIQQGKFTDQYPPEFVARIIRYLIVNYYDVLFDKSEAPTIEKIEQRLDLMFDFLQRGFQP